MHRLSEEENAMFRSIASMRQLRAPRHILHLSRYHSASTAVVAIVASKLDYRRR